VAKITIKKKTFSAIKVTWFLTEKKIQCLWVRNGVVVFATPAQLALKRKLVDAVFRPILIGDFDGKTNL
jgi:hypothetical protein